MSIQILGMQRFHLKYEIILALFRFISIYIGFRLFNNHFVSIGLFGFVGLLFNTFLIIYIYQKVAKADSLITQ